MVRVKMLAAVSAAGLAVAASAQADQYRMSFSAITHDGVVHDSGVVNFTTAGPGPGPITSVSGQIDGAQITGLSSYFGADNILRGSFPYASDFYGISVTTANDTYNFAGDNISFFDKLSTDPGQTINIPASEILGGSLNGVAGQSNQYALDFKTYKQTGGLAPDSGNLVFTTSGGLPGAVTGVSGEIDGSAVIGLSGFFGADNILYPDYPYASDFYGISVTTAQDTYNIAGGEIGFLDKQSTDPGGTINIPGSEYLEIDLQAVAGVPEPASWEILILGTGLAGVALRRRRALAA